jgi:hypothetical protein
MKVSYLMVFPCIWLASAGAWGEQAQHWVNLASVADPEVAQAIRARATEVIPDRFFIVPVETEDGRLYRVTGGPYMREALAEQLLAEARRAGFTGAWVSRQAAATAGLRSAEGGTLYSGLDPALYDGAGAGAFVDRAPPGHALHRLRREDGGARER